MYGFETPFPKRVNTKFVVKNIAPGNKCIKLFMYPINHGGTRDLLMIPTVSEADIRHSLLKGSLLIKILAKEIEVVDSNIDLMMFDPQQRQFLYDAGVRIGMEASGGITPAQYELLMQILRLSDGDGPVTEFPDSYRVTLPAADPFPTQIIWYDSIGPGAKKITEKTLTYDDQKRITRNEQITYDGTETVVARIIDEFAYVGPFEVYRHRTIAGS